MVSSSEMLGMMWGGVGRWGWFKTVMDDVVAVVFGGMMVAGEMIMLVDEVECEVVSGMM